MNQENVPPAFRTWLGYAWRKREFFYHPLGYLAVWVGTGMLYTGDLPAYLGLILGLALIGVAFTTVGQKYANFIQLHLLGSAVWATVFMTWGSFEAAWSPNPMQLLVTEGPVLRHVTLAWGLFGPLIGSLTWHIARASQIAHELQRYADWKKRQTAPAAITAGPAVPRNPQAALWEDMFAQWNLRGLTYVGQKPTEEGNRVIRMRLPLNGTVRFSQVFQMSENVEITLSQMKQTLPPGSVRIARYVGPDGRESSTDFVIILDLVDILSHLRWMPDDHRERSITEAFQIGVWQDGTPMFMTVEEIHWAIIAISRAGKSNLLNIIIYQISRCYDAVIWGIDMKGASTFKPWLMPWLEGALHPDTNKPVLRPVIDWLAVDAFEAERILRAFNDIVEDRPFRHSGGKLDVSREHPYIVLITDEISKLTGTHTNNAKKGAAHSTTFGGLFIDALSAGAGEGCIVIYATQRGTVDYSLPGNAQANVKGRICLGAADLQDVRLVLPKNPMASSVAAVLHHKGSLVMAAGEADRALAGRAFFLGEKKELDRRTYEAALLHGNIVPGLTRGTHEHDIACRWGYEDRFDDDERISWIHGTHKGKWYGKPLNMEGIDVGMPISAQLKRDLNKVADALDKAGDELTAEAQRMKQGPAAPTTSFFIPPPAAPMEKDPEQVKFDEIVGGVELEGFADSVAELVAAMDAASTDQSTAPAAQPGDADRVRIIVEFVDTAGRNGVMAGDIVNELIARGLLTEQGKTAIHRYIKQAKDVKKWGDLAVDQPGGTKTRYYTRRHTPTSRRAE